MNTTYTLTEGNDALNRVLLMMQYELGKTLNENVVLEQPESRFETQYNKDLMKKYDKPSKTMTLDEFMEDYREALTHPVMVGLEVALTSTGVGVGAVVATYTALLAYDVYKGVVEKDWDWLNIVFDVLGIVSSGVLSATLRPIMKGAQGFKFKNFREVLTYLTKTNKWYEIKPYLETGFSILKSVSKGIEKALLWISKKTGFKSLEYAGVSVESWVQKIVYDIQDFLTSSVKKTVKFLEPGAKVGTKTAIKRGIVAGVMTQGLKRLDRYANVKIPKWRNTDREDEMTPYIISENPEIYGKNIKFTLKVPEYSEIYYYLRDGKGNFYIYDVETKKYVKITNPEKIEEAKGMYLENFVYSKLKFNDFEVDNYDEKNPIYTINGVDYKMINDNFKLRKI